MQSREKTEGSVLQPKEEPDGKDLACRRHLEAQHPAVKHLTGKQIVFAISARDVIENCEKAREAQELARDRGYELWEPSGREFCVAQYSDVLQSIPQIALDQMKPILADEISPRSYGIMMY